MSKYIFLIARAEGTHSADGDQTKIHSSMDLPYQDYLGNEHVTRWEFDVPSGRAAENEGYRNAFFNNFTAEDSCSWCGSEELYNKDVESMKEHEKYQRKRASR